MAVRLVLPDEAWAEMAPIRTAITARAGSPPGLRERRCMAAVLSLARTGTPWRDLPEAVGHWEAVAHRLRRWARRGRWRQRWERLQTDPSPQTRSLLLAAPQARSQTRRARGPGSGPFSGRRLHAHPCRLSRCTSRQRGRPERRALACASGRGTGGGAGASRAAAAPCDSGPGGCQGAPARAPPRAGQGARATAPEPSQRAHRLVLCHS